MNESEIIQSKVLPALNEKGWNRHDLYYYVVEYDINSGEKRLIADIVLFKEGTPIGVIEVKGQNGNLNQGIHQAKLYANELNTNLVYATDGKYIFKSELTSQTIESITEFPSVEEIHKSYH